MTSPNADALFADYTAKARKAQESLRYSDAREAGIAWRRFINAFLAEPAEVIPFPKAADR